MNNTRNFKQGDIVSLITQSDYFAEIEFHHKTSKGRFAGEVVSSNMMKKNHYSDCWLLCEFVPAYKRHDILQSKVDSDCCVEFHHWVDVRKMQFAGHAVDTMPKTIYRREWSERWNAAVFENYKEAPMQSHLERWEVDVAITNYVAAKYVTAAYNIKLGDDGATYET
jgi:hypothetical protein